MLHHVPRRMSVAALSAAALLAACAKGDKAADTAKPADSAAMAMATPPAAPAPAPMTDGNILGKLDADNVADSSGGAMAVSKGTSPAVKEFGRMMMKDHHAMRVDGMALAKKDNITPMMPSDPDAAADKAAEESMASMAKGAAWDKAYIDHNVMGHEKVLAFAQSAMNTTQNADIKAMLQKATPAVQKHLDKAKDLQTKMGGAMGAMAPAAGKDTGMMKKP